MKRYNVGIIGYGWVARAQIAAINDTPLAKTSSTVAARSAGALFSRHGNRSAAGVDPRRGCGAATDGALTDVPLDVRAATGVHSVVS